jgi:hypothetical protein
MRQLTVAKRRFGSRASFDASGGDFRYYPERRHLLALQYLTKWGHEPTFGWCPAIQRRAFKRIDNVSINS